MLCLLIVLAAVSCSSEKVEAAEMEALKMMRELERLEGGLGDGWEGSGTPGETNAYPDEEDVNYCKCMHVIYKVHGSGCLAGQSFLALSCTVIHPSVHATARIGLHGPWLASQLASG